MYLACSGAGFTLGSVDLGEWRTMSAGQLSRSGRSSDGELTSRSASCSSRKIRDQLFDGGADICFLDRDGVTKEVFISMIRLHFPVLALEKVILHTDGQLLRSTASSHVMPLLCHFLEITKRFLRIGRLPPNSRPTQFQNNIPVSLPRHKFQR